MRQTGTTIRASVVAMALLLAMPFVVGAAHADDMATAPNDTILTDGGHRYACTGIAESKYDPRWKEFPLKIVAATVEGDYLGDIAVTVRDGNGTIQVATHCLAPWFLADLAPGRYAVTVVARGQYEKTVNVTVGTSQTQVVVHFEQINDT